MGILARFKDIMEANVNALLDKAEDPEKMVDQCIRNLNKDLGNVKAQTAAVMADEQRAKRELLDNAAQIEKMQSYAQKAVSAGNDDDARTFLSKKSTLLQKQSDLQASYDTAKSNSEKMRQMYDKLTKDLASVQERSQMIKSKVKLAKATEDINKMTSSATDAADSLSAFDKMEEKANRMLDEANAMTELNESADGGISKLEEKYDNADSAISAQVEDELAALKAKMGK